MDKLKLRRKIVDILNDFYFTYTKRSSLAEGSKTFCEAVENIIKLMEEYVTESNDHE